MPWGARRDSNARKLIHSQPPEPLGYGHHNNNSQKRYTLSRLPEYWYTESEKLGGPPGDRTLISCLQGRLLPVGNERPELGAE